MALDPDLIDHWLIWICLWENSSDMPLYLLWLFITLCRLLCVRRAYRQRGIGEQTLKCYLRCYFGVLLYTAGARNLLLTGREVVLRGVAEYCEEVLSRRCALGYNSPISRARAIASVRRWTCSLPKMCRLCPLTVFKARKSRWPIS